jgi:hypothetical protein
MLRARKNQFLVPMLAMTAFVLVPAAAHAVTAGDISITSVLNTSPLWADSQSYHACNVVNVSTSAVTVAIELISASGGVISASSLAVPAGTSAEVDDASGSGSSTPGFARCRFTLTNAEKTIRANMTIFHSLGAGTFQTYATSEAR